MTTSKPDTSSWVEITAKLVMMDDDGFITVIDNDGWRVGLYLNEDAVYLSGEEGHMCNFKVPLDVAKELGFVSDE